MQLGDHFGKHIRPLAAQGLALALFRPFLSIHCYPLYGYTPSISSLTSPNPKGPIASRRSQ